MMESTDAAVVSQNDIEAILNGPEYFTCERGHARMKKAACIERQKGVRKAAGGYGYYQLVPPECEECEQGEKIRRQTADDGRQIAEEKDMEEKVCKECGEEPVVAKGLGRNCYMKKRREDIKKRWKTTGKHDVKKRAEKEAKPGSGGEEVPPGVVLNVEEDLGKERIWKLRNLAYAILVAIVAATVILTVIVIETREMKTVSRQERMATLEKRVTTLEQLMREKSRLRFIIRMGKWL